MEKVDKITAVIFYLYFHKKMHPHSVAGAHKIDDVFNYACELLLNIDATKFEEISKEYK